jgi:hypothetical protein
MLYMVIERFIRGPEPVGARFRERGRMLPDDVTYHASWVDSAGARCFQVMEAPQPELLAEWTRQWDDVAEFEIVPVLTSADFWRTRSG